MAVPIILGLVFLVLMIGILVFKRMQANIKKPVKEPTKSEVTFKANKN